MLDNIIDIMSKLSTKNLERLKQEVLHILFQSNLTPLSTKDIAEEMIRDDELVLRLLLDLQKTKLVKLATNSYIRRRYWIMTPEAYTQYKKLL